MTGRAVGLNVLVSAIAIAVGLAVLELGVRAFDLAPPVESGSAQGLKAILQFDSVLQTRYKPNSETRIVSPYGEFDTLYRINELGLRDRPLRKKGTNELRVFVAGNSFVEGWGVSERDEFVRVAERAANVEGKGGKLVRLVNAGVSAYGAAQSYLQAKSIWSQVDPDLMLIVLVGTMVNSDDNYLKEARLDAAGIAEGLSADAVLSGGFDSGSKSEPVPPFLAKLARFSGLARLFAQRLKNRAAMDRIKIGDPSTDMLAAYRSGPDLLRTMYEPTFRHVVALAKLARSYGKPLLLLHLPMPFQVSADAWKQGRKAYRMEDRIYDSGEVSIVQEFCAAQALRCIFADPILKEAAARSASPLYFNYDFHLTPYGNEVLGSWLGDRLTESEYHTTAPRREQPQQSGLER